MGFRNPITTATDPTARAAAASAQSTANDALDQATNGIIPGSRLAADAIDGKTITGATVTGGTVQTAASGGRAEMVPATFGRVPVYNPNDGTTTLVDVSGGGLYRMRASDTDVIPSEMFATSALAAEGGGHLLRIDAGSTDNGTTKLPSFTATGGGTAGSVMAQRQLVIDDLDVAAIRAPLFVSPPTAAGHATPRSYVDGQKAGGSFTGTTDANGRVQVTHGLGQTPSYVEFLSTVLGAVDTNAFALVSMNATSFTVQLYYNGAPNKSATGTTFLWRVWK